MMGNTITVSWPARLRKDGGDPPYNWPSQPWSAILGVQRRSWHLYNDLQGASGLGRLSGSEGFPPGLYHPQPMDRGGGGQGGFSLRVALLRKAGGLRFED
uniref:Uncharacterized protein n=1 Tax=Plectus sambesii TaxID=2011161 RepID=A0A914W4W6_9BILA